MAIKLGEKKVEDEYEEIRERLHNEVVSDMANTQMELNMDDNGVEKANKKFNQLKLKKNVLYVVLLLTFVIINGIAVYKTFFKHEYTGQEIAKLSNYYNGKTNFNKDGVLGYLQSNIEELILSNVSYTNGVSEVSYENLCLTRIHDLNSKVANVYFNLTAKTTLGEQNLSCMIPIYWDSNDKSYHPCGQFMVTPASTSERSVSEKPNEFLSFEGIKEVEQENMGSCEAFINNFFTMLYSNQDISPYYNGETLHTNGLKYLSCEELKLYSEPNKFGYNCHCRLKLSSSNGIIYNVEKYMLVKKSGNSWIINYIL